MTFIVATNVVASRLPERRLTGTPHARANLCTLQEQLNGPAGGISLTNQLNGPVLFFEDWSLSLYIVAASESDEGFVFKAPCIILSLLCHRMLLNQGGKPHRNIDLDFKTKPVLYEVMTTQFHLRSELKWVFTYLNSWFSLFFVAFLQGSISFPFHQWRPPWWQSIQCKILKQA